MSHSTIAEYSHNCVTRANCLCYSNCSDTVHCRRTPKEEPIVLQKKPDTYIKNDCGDKLRHHFMSFFLVETHKRKEQKMSKVRKEGCQQQSNNLAISTASRSVPLKAPLSFAIAKFFVILLIPMPSVIVSNGFFSLLPSASSLVYITPRVTLLNKPEPGGSTRKHLMSGFFSC